MRATTRPGAPGGVAAPEVVAATTGVLYAAGGLATALAALADPARSGWQFAVAAVALATGAAALRWGAAMSTRVLHALVAGGTCLIMLSVMTAPNPLTAVALASVAAFVVIDTAYHFSRRATVWQLVLLLATTGLALGVRGVPLGAVAGFLVVLVAIAVVIGDLARRASGARRDPLTGLVNRRGFDDALEAAVADAVRSDAALSVALVDVDHFKHVNDAQGHAGGDQLLRDLAEDLRRLLPSHALVSRLGGDEFAVLLPRTDDANALLVVESARRQACHPLSVGVVGHLDDEGPGELLRRADAALYEAKQRGRDRSVRGDSASSHLARDLASALASPDGGGLHVVLQPVVSVDDGAVVGVEALARWEHPTRGWVAPLEFVTIAESAGLVRALGAFVLLRACWEAQPLRARWGDDLVLTVNASGHELVEADYADDVLAVLAETSWPARCLVVEVTESVVEGGSAAALATLARLRSHGVRVAIDDFGAGYSTFSRLDEVPADFLKLDKALLESATTSPRRRVLVEAVLSVSTSLGLRAIAEGVETADQAALLATLGCPLAQGYHYARPARSADLLAAGQREVPAPTPSS